MDGPGSHTSSWAVSPNGWYAKRPALSLLCATRIANFAIHWTVEFANSWYVSARTAPDRGILPDSARLHGGRDGGAGARRCRQILRCQWAIVFQLPRDLSRSYV